MTANLRDMDVLLIKAIRIYKSDIDHNLLQTLVFYNVPCTFAAHFRKKHNQVYKNE